MRKLNENNDLTCLRCKYIEQDIINSVQSKLIIYIKARMSIQVA